MEPLLYGHSAGVSEVALLIAVAFWTWIWGGIGLALATPLTVCLVVLGKYVPGLSFLQLILGDEAVIDPPRLYYQRLLAMDKTEAEEVATEFARKHKLIKVCDDLLIPALAAAKRDFKSGRLSAELLKFIVATTDEVLTKLCALKSSISDVENEPSSRPSPILCVPIDDEIDELIARMLSSVLPNWLELNIVSSQTLTGEVAEKAETERPPAVCLVALTPGGSTELRLLCKKLKTITPPLQIVISSCTLKGDRRLRELAEALEVTSIGVSLSETRNLLIQLSGLKQEPAQNRSELLPVLSEPVHN